LVIDIHVGLIEMLTTGTKLMVAESVGRPGKIAYTVTVLDAKIDAGAL
jgi:hypothetical protein